VTFNEKIHPSSKSVKKMQLSHNNSYVSLQHLLNQNSGLKKSTLNADKRMYNHRESPKSYHSSLNYAISDKRGQNRPEISPWIDKNQSIAALSVNPFRNQSNQFLQTFTRPQHLSNFSEKDSNFKRQTTITHKLVTNKRIEHSLLNLKNNQRLTES
jgi:hypothetical protein